MNSNLLAAEQNAEVGPAPSYHRKIAARIKAAARQPARPSALEMTQAAFRNWRLSLPLAGGIALVLGVFLAAPPTRHTTSPANADVHPTLNQTRDLLPTIGNYQMVANRSLEKFDQLLTEQGTRNLPGPVLHVANLDSPSPTSE